MNILKIWLVSIIMVSTSIFVDGPTIWGQTQRGVEIKGVVVSGLDGAGAVVSSSDLPTTRDVQFGETLPRGKGLTIQTGGRTEFLVDATSVITAEEHAEFMLRREGLSEPAVVVQQGKMALAVSQKLKQQDNWVHLYTPSFVAKTKGGLIDVDIQKPASHAQPKNNPPTPHIIPTAYQATVVSNKESLIETLQVREGSITISFPGKTAPLTLEAGETLHLLNGQPTSPSANSFDLKKKPPLPAIVAHHRSPKRLQEDLWDTELQQAALLGETAFGAKQETSEDQQDREEQVVLATTGGSLTTTSGNQLSRLQPIDTILNTDPSFDQPQSNPLSPPPNVNLPSDNALEPRRFVSVLDFSQDPPVTRRFTPFTRDISPDNELNDSLILVQDRTILIPSSTPAAQVFKTELTGPTNFSLIALLNATLGEAEQSLRNALIVRVEQIRVDSIVDSALVEATKPLVSLVAESSMTTTEDLFFVQGRSAQNESATITANLIPGDALVQVASNSTLNVGGSLANLTNGGALNVTGHLASLTQNSTLNVAGALVSLAGDSTFSLTGGSLLAFGSGTNTANFTNTLCGSGCQNIAGIPVALSGGALSSQVQVAPMFVPFSGVGEFTNANNQLNLNNGQAAILEVTGPQATVQLGP